MATLVISKIIDFLRRQIIHCLPFGQLLCETFSDFGAVVVFVARRSVVALQSHFFFATFSRREDPTCLRLPFHLVAVNNARAIWERASSVAICHCARRLFSHFTNNLETTTALGRSFFFIWNEAHARSVGSQPPVWR